MVSSTLIQILGYSIRENDMINHHDLHIKGFTGRRQLAGLIRERAIQFAGNRKLKIYGKLSCISGKKMKPANRVFFTNEQEAIAKGYHPCGHCLRRQYLLWKGNK